MRMFIEKFGKEVEIDADHPLAIAQREKNAAVSVGKPAGEGDAPISGEAEQEDRRSPDQDAAIEEALLAGKLPPADRRADGADDLPGNFENFSKAELAKFAQERFGIELDKDSMNKAAMLEAIQAARTAQSESQT